MKTKKTVSKLNLNKTYIAVIGQDQQLRVKGGETEIKSTGSDIVTHCHCHTHVCPPINTI